MRQTRMGFEPEKSQYSRHRQGHRVEQDRMQDATEPSDLSRALQSKQPHRSTQDLSASAQATEQSRGSTGRTRATAEDVQPPTERERAWQRIQRDAPEHAAFLEAMRQTFGRIQLQHFTLGNERIWP